MSGLTWRASPFLAFFGCLMLSACERESSPVVPTPTPEPQPVPAPEPPGLVTGIHLVERGDDFIVLMWDEVEGATGYRGHVYPAGTPTAERPPLVEVVEPSFRAGGLGPGRYHFHVQAVTRNSVGSAVGDWSSYGPFVSFYERGTPRECKDERAEALRYTDRDRSGVVSEWDGTPFVVDFIDNFPACWDHAYLGDLLAGIEHLAAQIEGQVGYRVVQPGEIIESPTGWVPLEEQPPRERGQILGFFLPGEWRSGAAAAPYAGTFWF